MHSPTLKRLALAAVVAGTAITAVPAAANAASTCSYNTFNKTLIVTDGSGSAPLKLFRTPGGELRYSDGLSSKGLACFVPGTPGTANVTNTEKVAVFSNFSNAGQTADDGFYVDQGNGVLGPGATKETDGLSEIEVAINTATSRSDLTVVGTNGGDEIRVGKGGEVNLGLATTPISDRDADVTMTTEPTRVTVLGRGGNDMLSGHGDEVDGVPAPYNRLMSLNGSEGADLLIGGNGVDSLSGGNGDDHYVTVDGTLDSLIEATGATGTDVAEMDSFDHLFGAIEQRFVSFPR